MIIVFNVTFQETPVFVNKAIQVNIVIDDYPEDCPNCFARNNPKLTLCDHLYSSCYIEPDHEKQIGSLKASKQIESVETNASDNDTDNDSDFYMNDLSTPTKNDEKTDPMFIPDQTESPCTPQEKNDEPTQKSIVNEPKYIVFRSCLMQLFSMMICSTCNQNVDTDDINYRSEGTSISVSFTCMNGHSFKWQSQPLILNQPAGYILTTAATVISGGTFATLNNFAKAFNLQFLSSVTFNKIENRLVIPSIDKFWNLQKNISIRNMLGRNLVVMEDVTRLDTVLNTVLTQL